MRLTSIEAYNKIVANGLLQKTKLDIYRVLVFGGSMTAGEIYQQIPHCKVKGSISAILVGLRRSGCVQENGERKCSFSGHKAIVWEITGELPSKIGDKTSPRKLLRSYYRLCREILKKIEDQSYLTDPLDSFCLRTKDIMFQTEKYYQKNQ